MNGFEKISAKSAVKARKIEDLSRTHLTTLDFGQIIAMFGEETIPGGEYPVKANYFSRLAPLVKPTYGKAYFKTATMYVPYFQLADNFEGWVSAKNIVNGEAGTGRFILQRDILKVFNTANIVVSVSATDVANGAWFDLRNKDNTTDKYYKFTNTGRYYIKVLNSLGYVIPMNGNVYTNSSWYKGYGAEKFSAFPLLAFAKAYNDWMSQSQRYNISILTKFLTSVKKDKTMTYGGSTVYDATTHTITHWGIILILDNIRLGYENDYFTSAWQYPNAPIEGEGYKPNGISNSVDDAQISKVYWDEAVMENSNDRTNIKNEYGGTEIVIPMEFSAEGSDEEGMVSVNGTVNAILQQRSLDWLKAFDNYVRRNNYAGSKDVQQMYARFGIKVEDYKTNYAHVINTTSAPIQIGDVTATGQDYVGNDNANNIELGDYAGKGIINTGENYNYKANDFGYLVTLGWVTVAPMNVYGIDKAVKRNKPMDYYTPEFDGIGPEAIAVDEVFTNPRIWSTTQPNAIFGFTERYNSYRYGKDRITGDFRKMALDSGTYANVGTEMNTWHLGRMLNSQLMNETLVAQNPDFNVLKQTDSEYNRIFSKTDGNEDHFYITAQFECKAMLPIMSLNQVPQLGEGDTVIARNGNEIN